MGGLLAGSALLALYLVASANLNGATGGDWLAFAGVFFGVMATMVGTIAVERWRERRKHSRATRQLIPAVDEWIATVEGLPDIPGNSNIADLKEQCAYIAILAAGINRDDTQSAMAAHAFCFHIPTMIDRLREAVSAQPGPKEAVIITLALNDMKEYGRIFRQVLSVKRVKRPPSEAAVPMAQPAAE